MANNDGIFDSENDDITVGDVTLGETGLSLPIDLAGEVEAPASEEITQEDLLRLAQVEAELDQRWLETKIDPTFRRMSYMMDLMGQPQNSFPAIHVAGTNGKTSTA